MLELIPAIDLRGGRCVRLFQGNYTRETVFGTDPLAVAHRWQDQGAPRLHIVDLDGARDGYPVQLDLVRQISQAVTVPVQLGGGLRELEHVRAAVEAGVARVVLGTSAIHRENQESAASFRQRCLAEFGERVLVGLDAREGKLAVRGWLESTSIDAFDFAEQLRSEGFRRIVYTDIRRDGTLAGPNLDHIRRLLSHDGLRVVASGGVHTIDDLLALQEAGAEAAVVGQALYAGSVHLTEALERLRAAGTGG